MPGHHTHQPNQNQPTTLRILQINLNKSEKAHLELLNNLKGTNWDIVLVQEPHVTSFSNVRTPTNYRPVFPENRGRNGSTVRSVVWVSTALETRDWKIIHIPDTNDITAIQLSGTYGTLTIFNIYNDCTNSDTEDIFNAFLRAQERDIFPNEQAQMIWAGDFNRHHPLWDRDEDTHLFTEQASRAAEQLITLLAEYDMAMPLPKGIPTLQHMRSKRFSRPDNFFCTSSLQDDVIRCDVEPGMRPPCTDHFPIVTVLTLNQPRTSATANLNFREVDWEVFRRTLKEALKQIPDPMPIASETLLTQAAKNLTGAIQTAIAACVKRSKPRPDSKRWWNRDLKKMRRRINRLRTVSFRYRALTGDPVHRELRDLSNAYGEAILLAKRQHWTDYLEDMNANDIWVANRYLRDPVGDGGSPRIPTLKYADANGQPIEINDSQDKAETFTSIFFPPPPPASNIPPEFTYPPPLPDPPLITKSQIERQIHRLSPYKAYGPDEISNIVLQKCIDLITDYLLYIFRAILKLGKYYDPWRESTTVVLRKPGKPRYDVPKAYRPVVLLSTLAKVLTAIVAEDISQLAERHQLLPKTHFGGRPGRTTTDAIHYLVHRVKEAWRNNKVASVLFLDVEGAFPNAVTERLLHNLRRRRIPAVYITFIEQLLTGRRTRLKFDDFISESLNILNGIGQGDPLSMILYILYNADLLEIIVGNGEDSAGFVDDIALIAVGDSFEESTGKLEQLMTKEGGGLEWSREHNSNFETSKSVVLHLTRRTQPDPADEGAHIPLARPQLFIQGQLIREVTNFKYLGAILDAQLRWNEQTQRVTANATKWLLQFRRLTRPSTGVSSKLMRQLYLAVALPKITYGLQVWYVPPTKPVGATRNTGSVGVLKSLQKLQRIATLAITGAMRTTPTDLLDAHAGALPMELALLKICHKAAVRLLTLPTTHPLHSLVQSAVRSLPAKHPSAIDNLLRIFQLARTKVEPISPINEGLHVAPRFLTEISASREQSIENEKQDGADFKVFTDGSDHDGGVGAAAVMYKKGWPRPIAHLKTYLGPTTEHNSYEAEVVGGILATWLIKITPDTRQKSVSIYSDNQPFVKISRHPKATPGQYLLREFASAANKSQATIRLKWISGHSDVRGNEKADKLAKEAAEGRASRRVDQPPFLQRTLPVSVSSCNRAHLDGLKKRWETEWWDSPRRGRFERVDDAFPFNGFRKRQYKLSRAHASYMMQVRSGHFPLNYYLHRIGKTDSKCCQACRIEPNEETPTESIRHFIYDCEAYSNQRRILTRTVGAGNLAIKDIMTQEKRMKALAQYITATKRFVDGR
jgi:ribonuclease HI/exonuclease III